MTCGIYAIVCTKTWRSYVGQSVNIEKRLLCHFAELKRNSHSNKELQSDYNKFIREDFSTEILEVVNDKPTLIDQEKYWQNFGCNLYSGEVGYKTIPSLNEKQIDYFWSFVDKTGENDCWEWTGIIQGGGYGRIKLCQKQLAAHRLSFFLTNPDVNQSSVVCHNCNNRKCVNPDHLRIGTIQDNVGDKFKSGSSGVLTWEEVNLIRQKFKENPNIKGGNLDKWFYENVRPIKFTREYLIDVARNITWFDVNYIPPNRKMRKINLDIAKEIRTLHNSGLSYSKINKVLDEKYNTTLNPASISNIINNKLYKEN